MSSALLRDELQQKVYMRIPKYMAHASENKVFLLNKTIYGLRESPRIWYDLLSWDLINVGLTPLRTAPCVFLKEKVLLQCYAGDLLLLEEDD